MISEPMPVLRYVETHLTDHCNLNCRGCGHCAPIAETWFADGSSFRRDMDRLARLFSNIAVIRLMGGEPLLHPDAAWFFRVTRQAFPRAEIALVTNGILLRKMGASFWGECREHRIRLSITLYPPTRKYEDEIIDLCKTNNVLKPIVVRTAQFHCRRVAGSPGSDPLAAMRYCRSRYYCPFLRDGRLYPCPAPVTQKILDTFFSLSREHDRGIDIHSPQITGEMALNLLNRPVVDCACCSETDLCGFEWGLSKKAIDEWLK